MNFNKNSVGLGIIFGLTYFIFNFILIHFGHFHEDAYIMFVYVDNIVNGFGVSFYPGGPNAEGATDFLWLVFLVALGKIGLDAGTSSIVLNSIGIFLSGYLLSNLLNTKRKGHFLFLLFIFLCFLQLHLVAALGGFSVYFYTSFVLLTFVCLSKYRAVYVPILSLLLGLIRPDGVILGVMFTVYGLRKAIEGKFIKAYLLSALVAFFLGVCYFVTRYFYFSEVLPLPLYVKSAGKGLPGLYANITWLGKISPVLIGLLFLAISNRSLKKVLSSLSTLLVFFVSLTFAAQTQNVGFRFQAPMTLIIYYIFVEQLIYFYDFNNMKKIYKTTFVSVTVFLLLISSVYYLAYSVKSITRKNYVNQFAHDLSTVINNQHTIVLTEAGRLAYWNQAGTVIVDLVGLNTPFPAKNLADIDYVETISPDVIMYHHAYLIDVPLLQKSGDHHSKPFYVELNENDKHLLVNKLKLSRDERERNKVLNASYVLTNYLADNYKKYHIIFVDYTEDGKLKHVYAFRKGEFDIITIRSLLDRAFMNKKNQKSYYETLEVK